MRRSHLSIALGLVLACSFWIASLTNEAFITLLFALFIPAAAVVVFVIFWRKGGALGSGDLFSQSSQYRRSTLHSRHRVR